MKFLQSLELPHFKALYDLQSTSAVPNYDLATLCVYLRSNCVSYQSADSLHSIQHRKYTFQNSLTTNPYFFYAPFASIGVANAAHTFIRTLPPNLVVTLLLIETSGLDVKPFCGIPKWHTRQGNSQVLLRNHWSSRWHTNIHSRPWTHPRQLVPSSIARTDTIANTSSGTAALSAPSTTTPQSPLP